MGSRGVVSSPQKGPQAADRQSPFQARRALTGQGSQRFPRPHRLSRPAEFERIHRTGKRRRLLHLDVWWTDNLAGHPRMGLIVPKFQSTGVARNRLRRRIRELWRRELQLDLPAWDVVIRARREAYGASPAALRQDLTAWRAGAE